MTINGAHVSFEPRGLTPMKAGSILDMAKEIQSTAPTDKFKAAIQAQVDKFIKTELNTDALNPSTFKKGGSGGLVGEMDNIIKKPLSLFGRGRGLVSSATSGNVPIHTIRIVDGNTDMAVLKKIAENDILADPFGRMVQTMRKTFDNGAVSLEPIAILGRKFAREVKKHI